MKTLILIAFILMAISCKVKPKFYSGYVYFNEKPLQGVIVKKDNQKLSDMTQTDSIGFFKLHKEPNSIYSLIFKKKGFTTDTIPSVWSQHGEKIKYTFLNKYPDTINLQKNNLIKK